VGTGRPLSRPSMSVTGDPAIPTTSASRRWRLQVWRWMSLECQCPGPQNRHA